MRIERKQIRAPRAHFLSLYENLFPFIPPHKYDKISVIKSTGGTEL